MYTLRSHFLFGRLSLASTINSLLRGLPVALLLTVCVLSPLSSAAACAPGHTAALSQKALAVALGGGVRLQTAGATAACSQPTGALASQLTYVGQASGRYSENVVLAAQLTDGGGVPLGNRSLGFVIGVQTLTAITNANGVAQITTTAATGQDAVTIRFAGDSAYGPSAISASVIIAPELTSLLYTGNLFLGDRGPQTLSATLTDSLQRPVANENITFSIGTAQTHAITNAQGTAVASITLSSDSDATAPLTVSFAGDTNYAAAQQSLQIGIYPPTHFVVWGGNAGGLQLGQTVNFVGKDWFKQVQQGQYQGGDDFDGIASQVPDFQLCNSTGSNRNGNNLCWEANLFDHRCSSRNLPQSIGVIVSNDINRDWDGDAVEGNIAALAVCNVLPADSQGYDRWHRHEWRDGDDRCDRDRDWDERNDQLVSRSCVLSSVIADGAHIFPAAGSAISLTQSQPAALLPNQTFTVSVIANNQWKIAPVNQVTLNETFSGATPAIASTSWNTISPGASVTFSAQEKTSVIPTRQPNETSSAYESRLASIDGSAVSSSGTVNFTDASGTSYLPARASSSSHIQIPRLSLGLSTVVCAAPGGTIPISISISNIGLGKAASAAVVLTLPDGSTSQLAVPSLASGAIYATTYNWSLPLPPQETSGQSTVQYLQALTALDGKGLTITASLTWQDTLANSYGSVQSQLTTTSEHLPIVSLSGQVPASLLPGQTFNAQLTAQNTGSGNAVATTIVLKDPSGKLTSVSPFVIAAGQSATTNASVTTASIAARGTGETTSAYLARLLSIQGPYNLDAATSWSDVAGAALGITHTTLSSSEVLPAIAVSLTGPATANAGTTISYTLTLTNQGGAMANAIQAIATLPDGSVQALSVPQGNLAAGATTVVTFAFTPQQAGTFTTTATITWADAAQNSYGPVSASSNVTVAQSLTVSAGANQTAAISSAGILPLTPTLISLGSAPGGVSGIDYQQTTNEILLSENPSNTQSPNLGLLANDGTSTSFSNLSGLGTPLHTTVARNEGGGLSQGGFPAGTVLSASTTPGVLIRTSADGSVIQNPWVTLPGETGVIDGLYIDRTGAFSGNLIVLSSAGNLWQVNASGAPALLANIGTSAPQGLITVPTSPAYGPWAGKILTSGGSPSTMIAVDSQGNSSSYNLAIVPEFLLLVNPTENFFGIDSTTNLWGIPAPELSGMVGDVLAGEASGNLWQLHWNGSHFETTRFAQVNTWTSATMAPAGVTLIPSTSTTATLQGSVTEPALPPGGVLTAAWSQVSGPGIATFASPNAMVTSVTLNKAGVYVLRLTGSDSVTTATSDVTVTVTGNQAPAVSAGANQQINFPSQATLNGSVTDDGLPSGTLYNFWTVKGPAAVTLPFQPYDPVAGFSITSNPNGVWSYGWTATLGGTFTPYAITEQSPFDLWFRDPNTGPYIGFNNTGANLQIGTPEWPLGALAMYPGPNGEDSVLRWTAPAAGTYLVQGRFFAEDVQWTGTTVAIQLNSNTILTQSINGNEVSPGSGAGVPFSFVQTVKAGDMMDFAVGFGVSGFSFATTGLMLAITPASTAATTASFSAPGDYDLRLIGYDGTLFGQQDADVNVVPVCVAPPSGLVGWWPGDGNTTDIVGGDNGVLQGSVSFAPGEVGQAFNFPANATQTDVFLAPTNALNTSSFTMDAWILPDDFSILRPILEYNTNGTFGVHFWIDLSDGSGNLVPGALYANVVDTSGTWHTIGTGANAVVLGQWNHVAVTYDQASGQAALYSNGVSLATANLGSFVPQTSYPLYIGTRPTTSYNFFGEIDEVDVFNRALSAQEVQSIYLAETAGKCKPN